MLGNFISEIAYYMIFSVIMSIALLSTILYYRTKDQTIWHFLGVLYMQTVLFLIGFFIYLFTFHRISPRELGK